MMPDKGILKTQFLRVVDNQLRENNPPETRLTIERLMAMGYSREEARLFIAQCVAAEIFHVMQSNEPFNQERYIKTLEALPQQPK
jgi:predicted nucleic-acid-binding protein